MFNLLFLSTLLATTLAAHSPRSSHRHHYGTLQRLRRQQVDQEEVVRGSGQDCQVRLPQSDIDQWATWMQEGFNACTKSAGDSLSASNDPSTQVVMCYRIGFVDAERQRFGGELLVMQVGNSNDSAATLSSSSSDSSSASIESSPSSSATESSSSSSASIVDLTAVSASDPANLGVDLSSSSASASASAIASSAGGVGAAVIGFNTVDVVGASASASASSSSSVGAGGVGAAVLSSGAVPLPTAKARMVRRQRGSDKEGGKLPQGQFRVQVSWGKGSQAITSSLLLVADLGDDLSSSTSIDAPALNVKIADQQAQLLGSTHFTRAFPAGTDFDGQDLTVLAPTSIDLIGQAGTMESVQTHLVDLSSISAAMTGFGEVEKGLFAAQSSRSNKLTFDDRCLVTPDEEQDVGVAALSSESSSVSSSVETLDSSTFAPAAAAVETSSTSSSSVAVQSGNGQAGVGAAFLSSSAVPFTPAAAAASASSTSSSAPAAGVGAVAAATSTVSLGGNVIAPSSAAAAPSSSAAPIDGQAQAANDNGGDEAFQLPGREIQVLPIGLGVFAGVSVLALIIVGIVTYERRKYRAQFRARKMAEQVAHASFGATTNMREGRV